jgi:hypothetical protein
MFAQHILPALAIIGVAAGKFEYSQYPFHNATIILPYHVMAAEKHFTDTVIFSTNYPSRLLLPAYNNHQLSG